MGKRLADELLADLNGFISSVMGLHFTESRLGDLERGIVHAAKDFGFERESDFIDWLRTTPLKKEHIERLASHLTVGETYFFRDSSSFDALEHNILPELIEARRASKRIRVWSAGCSTGEEPYSIAILLRRLVPDISSWNVNILATDINAASLKKAYDGVYTEWSFRETPGWIRNRYFTSERAGSYRIDPEIQKMVSFGYLNLAEDIYPSLLNGTNGVDIIFCRNVIMYLSDAVAKSVVNGLHKSLVDDGWLLVSPAEAVRAVNGLFTPTHLGGSIFYRKSGCALEAPQILPEMRAEPQIEAQPPAEKAAPPLSPAPEARVQAPPAPDTAGRDQLAEAGELYRRGLYSEAARALEALEDNEKGAGDPLLLARAYANMGRLEEASRWCERVQAADALDKAAYILLATIRQEQARGDDAIQNLKKALYIDQDFVIAHFMLGKLLLARGGCHEQAMRHIRTAHKLLVPKDDDDLLPESDGMMAGRLKEILASMFEGSMNG
jgi:chemotaxis protein methyltransferase CheR